MYVCIKYFVRSQFYKFNFASFYNIDFRRYKRRSPNISNCKLNII